MYMMFYNYWYVFSTCISYSLCNVTNEVNELDLDQFNYIQFILPVNEAVKNCVMKQ